MKLTPQTGRASLNIVAHAWTIESPPTPGGLGYSLNESNSEKLTEF